MTFCSEKVYMQSYSPRREIESMSCLLLTKEEYTTSYQDLSVAYGFKEDFIAADSLYLKDILS